MDTKSCLVDALDFCSNMLPVWPNIYIDFGSENEPVCPTRRGLTTFNEPKELLTCTCACMRAQVHACVYTCARMHMRIQAEIE